MAIMCCLFTFFVVAGLATKATHSNQDDCSLLLSTQWIESVKMAVNMTKAGFHRDLSYTVTLDNISHGDMEALIIQDLSSGVFLDVYQLQSLKDDTGLQVSLDQEVDLEAPAYESQGFTALVYPRPDPAVSGQFTATVPIHGRYHRPSHQGAAEKVEISYPRLLLRTPTCQQPPPNVQHKTVAAPCALQDSRMCLWLEIENVQATQPLAFFLPVGKKSLTFLVCGGTLFITVICNIFLSATIWKHATFSFL